jgi:hypothetical protein
MFQKYLFLFFKWLKILTQIILNYFLNNLSKIKEIHSLIIIDYFLLLWGRPWIKVKVCKFDNKSRLAFHYVLVRRAKNCFMFFF